MTLPQFHQLLEASLNTAQCLNIIWLNFPAVQTKMVEVIDEIAWCSVEEMTDLRHNDN